MPLLCAGLSASTGLVRCILLFAAILALNLTRELQMQVSPRVRGTIPKRATLWCFQETKTIRRTLIQRAGQVIRPVWKNDPIHSEFDYLLIINHIQSMNLCHTFNL